MNSKDFSLLSVTASQSNSLYYNTENTETESPTTFQYDSRQRALSRNGPNNRKISKVVQSTLLEQVKKIQDANDLGHFSLGQRAREEYGYYDDFLRDRHMSGNFVSSQQSSVPYENAFDHEIELLGVSAFNPPANVQSGVRIVSAASKTIQVVNIISNGVLESIEEGFSKMCSFTHFNQRVCDHVVDRSTSLALAASELVKKQWDGSNGQRAYKVTAESAAECWQRYIESSDRYLMREGLSSQQIEQYNKDLEVIRDEAGTLFLTCVGAGAASHLVRGVKTSMHLVKTQVTSPLTLSMQLSQAGNSLKRVGIGVVNDMQQTVVAVKENIAFVQQIQKTLMSKSETSLLRNAHENYYHRKSMEFGPKIFFEDVKTPLFKSWYFMPADCNLEGWVVLQKKVLNVTLEDIQLPKGRLYNWLSAIQDFKNLAKANDANILRFLAPITDENLLKVTVKRYGKPSIVEKKIGGKILTFQRFDIPIRTHEMRILSRKI